MIKQIKDTRKPNSKWSDQKKNRPFLLQLKIFVGFFSGVSFIFIPCSQFIVCLDEPHFRPIPNRLRFLWAVFSPPACLEENVLICNKNSIGWMGESGIYFVSRFATSSLVPNGASQTIAYNSIFNKELNNKIKINSTTKDGDHQNVLGFHFESDCLQAESPICCQKNNSFFFCFKRYDSIK